MSAQPDHLKEIVVLGAGVIGLTTALKIQNRGGYRVTIIAEVLPGDPKSVKYTSLWAGAHHVSVARTDLRQREMDIETFNTMWELSASGGDAEGCFMRLPQTEYYRTERSKGDTLDLMPNFKELSEDWIIREAVSGITYDSVNTDTPVFLSYLLARFLAVGGAIFRGSVQHIDQVIEGGAQLFSGSKSPPSSPEAVIVCLGLGARFLGGVEDGDVYPVRGQTVLIRAPWVTSGMSISGGPSNVWTYVIPRRSGDVIIGGTYDANDWYPVPRPETTRDIIERVLAICPDIAPLTSRLMARKPTVEDVLPIVIEEGCGFRPARKGGIRLENEVREAHNGKKVAVVHNYGHGGYGFLASFGSASMALELLEDALSKL
ncbi:D-amino-acid oxidase [Crucibulum laeve]|uniref:D-amino-acid oxidase n=1 Tax=Crucibulum laeve TaxID=68775 RepID=A0A5C3M848_9AGAR|nr:D-amino-acid oxidase [Crucibulum laeve]